MGMCSRATATSSRVTATSSSATIVLCSVIFISSGLLNIVHYFLWRKKGEGKHDESSNVVLAAPGWEKIEHQCINNQLLSLRN